MGKPLIVVRSITYAIRGQRVLESHGITSVVQRNLEAMQKFGCGYGLKVNGNLETAKELLSRNGIKILAVFES